MCIGIGQKIPGHVHQNHANDELRELVKDFSWKLIAVRFYPFKLKKKISLDLNWS